ncbi:MAG: DUF3887 domain-containing protein [Acidobacteriota bacterium]|jgi:hypothetical protein|nr:DUF3887 domain-containing protein [Acidobacteriota bacterium]
MTAQSMFSRISSQMVNPFSRTAGAAALAVGLAAMFVSAFLAWNKGSVFDGVLDFHPASVSLVHACLFQLVNWLALGLVMFAAGAIFSPSCIRSIDVLGVMALAKVPFLLLALVLYVPVVGSLMNGLATSLPTTDTRALPVAGVLILSVAVLLALVWFVILAFNGFRVACNVRKPRLVPVFIVGILVAELLAFAANHSLISYAFAPTGTILADGIASTTDNDAPRQAVADGDMKALALKIAALMEQREYEATVAFFDDTMKAALPPEKLRQTLDALEKQLGAWKKTGSAVRSESRDGYRLLFVPVTFGETSLNMQLVFDRENRVSGLFFRPQAFPGFLVYFLSVENGGDDPCATS